MEWLKLIGILIIVIGFTLRLNTIAVVLVSGIVTGLVSGLGLNQIMDVLGEAFVRNRYMTVFVLTLPAIGIMERYGLKERASALIKRIKAATSGRINDLYLVIRTVSSAFGMRLGGHVQFTRPLVLPMSEGADEKNYGELEEEDQEAIKGISAASENFGNFFGQNVFPASAGVLLVAGVLDSNGYPVDVLNLAKYALVMAIAIFFVGTAYFALHDRKLRMKYKKKGSK
ncbi:MAG: DUF969 domain-containing protein [Spirochaetales bacterium]|nr:DUF969 domain-containing protein [Spirochaetales bacterium]